MSQKYKGGTKASQKRYRERHAEKIRQRKREEYQRNKKRYQEYHAKWKRDNKKKWLRLMRASNHRQRKKLRMEMVEAYGGKCVCCGEKEPLFLELDHINNDGNEDRKKNGAGVKLLGRLRKDKWPKDKYQLLCCNCNKGKARNGGICPHKKKRE